ncbi:MAG: hypothetical protein AAGF47_07170 [Planctomycetota bacterium]
MDRSGQTARSKPAAWLQPSGVTLLIAVSVLASASTGLQNAKRFADTGVCLVHAFVSTSSAVRAPEPAPGGLAPGWSHRPAGRGAEPSGINACRLSGAARAGLLDLPPPAAA